MQIMSLAVTGVLAGYVAMRYRNDSVVKACVMSTGFFTVGVYLDMIFFLIMEGAGGSGSEVLQAAGILISKGILGAGLLADAAIGQGSVWSRRGRVPSRQAGGFEMTAGEGGGEGNGQNWRYMDGLTVGITLFFLFLAVLTWCNMPISQSENGRAFVRPIHDLNTGHINISSSMQEDVSELDFQRGGLLTAWILTLFLAVLLAYYSSYFLYEKKWRENKKKFGEEAQKREAEVYLESVENHYQRTRELWHDLKNHITLLSMLLQEGKYAQMEDYLRIFAEDVDGLTLPMKSGNLVVDALLADKLAKAGKEGISFQLSLCSLTDLPLRPDEVCGLFGNLLDNALEAGRQAAEGKFIAVECEEREYCYYIRVRNSMRNDKGQGGIVQSAKPDRRNQVGHGLGLRSVERIVHSCGGEILTDSAGSCFTVAVRLPKDVG